MRITFRASPELLKIDEIGESIIEVEESLRRQIVLFVLDAVRNGDIPLRVKTGFKVSPDGLESVKSNVRLTAKHKAEVRARRFSSLDLEIKLLRRKEEQYIESESHMQGIARGAKLAMYDDQILNLAHLQERLIEGERELQRLDESVELDRIYRKQFVQLSEVADWLRKEQGFDVSIAESNIPRDDTLVLQLAKWFDKPINDLPPKLRKLADLYIPNWPELSGADRRVQADEVDRQRQDALAAKFEKYRREAEQANAATPDRFKEREFQDGFNRVQRIKNGERDFEAKLGAVNLSRERCIELAHSRELRIADWIELTGVGHGWCGAFLITKEMVSFGEWDDDYIRNWPLDWQEDMDRDNEQPPLKFPCTPIELLHFVDTACHDLYGFSVPDDFRQAMTAIEQATAPAPQVPEEVRGQAAPSGAPEKPALEVTLADDDEEGDLPKLAMEPEQKADDDAEIAALFDPVKVATLEAMFPDGNWSKYAERANRNGLKDAARTGRGEFNPYSAAVWWIARGPDGWKWERCLRVLANNLPRRSIDSRHLLTGDYDD